MAGRTYAPREGSHNAPFCEGRPENSTTAPRHLHGAASTVVVFLPLFVDGSSTTRALKRVEYPVRQ